MPRGSKQAYTSKQKRKAEHIEEGYKKRGVSSKTAAARAWATVNKQDGGGKKKKAAKKAASTRKRAAAKGRRKAKRSTRSTSKGARKSS